MYSTIITVGLTLLHVAAIFSLLSSERRRPSSTLAWLLALALIPGGGLIFYLFFGQLRARRVAKKYLEVTAALDDVVSHSSAMDSLRAAEFQGDPRTRDLILLGDRLASTPATDGNHAEILIDAEETYEAIRVAIEKATDHVHVEYYVVQPDEAGRALRDLLADRARAGVRVRVVTDGLGSGALPDDFWEPLIDAGGEATVFRPVVRLLARLPWRDRIDYRNHRKIIVIDGLVGFTGGINIGREYLGLDEDLGYWRDTHLRIEGPAVLALQKAFGEDWLQAQKELLDDPRLYPEAAAEHRGDLAISVIDSGPDREHSPISYLLTHGFALARERIWITNPYFVPGPSVEEALTAAALRGVDVRLLLPLHSDSKLVQLASASYFNGLLRAGVKIYRYSRGFVHAKTMVIDHWVGTVGSANMDMRSFHLNFELNAFVFGKEFCDTLAETFERDLDHAEPLNIEDEEKVRPPLRMLRACARMLAPLL